MARAAGTVKRLTLGRGGNGAGIVLPDVDPKEVAEGPFRDALIDVRKTMGGRRYCYPLTIAADLGNGDRLADGGGSGPCHRLSDTAESRMRSTWRTTIRTAAPTAAKVEATGPVMGLPGTMG